MGIIENMPSIEHENLSALGVKWLKRRGFPVIATNISSYGCLERADVIGFRSTCSVIIESKISRTDFLADSKKKHRTSDGIGLYRFYICPSNLIKIDEVPDKWGLLYVKKNKIIEIVCPKGNLWTSSGTNFPDWTKFQHKINIEAERSILFSIARRLVNKKSLLK